MYSTLDNKLNPNPVTKFLVLVILGFSVVHYIHIYFAWMIVFIISIMYFVNGYKKDALKTMVIFGIVSIIPNFSIIENLPIVFKIILSFVVIAYIFYLPFIAASFLIKTSDVGSIISSMDACKIPSIFSIPISVVFRFFPSFIEERNNIKMAIKIRGIKTLNPIKYMEYVAVPLLIISSNIAEDISKAAQTKCIENPIKKSRYIKISIKSIDIIYFSLMLALIIGGYLCY